MSSEEKIKTKTKKEIEPVKNSPIEEGMDALEELFIETFKIDPADPRLKKVMNGYRALLKKIEGMEMAAKAHSDEIYNVKQKMNNKK